MNVISIPYPPEYKDLAPNTALLKRIAEETHGSYDPDSSSLFKGKFRQSKTYTDIWRLLAMLSMLLLPIDVAVRRLQVTPEQAVELYRALLGYLIAHLPRRRPRVKQERSEAMSALLRSKKEAAKQIQPDDNAAEPAIVAPPSQPKAAPAQPKPKIKAPAAKSDAQSTPAAASNKKEEQTSATDLASRLLEAKRRAREKKE